MDPEHEARMLVRQAASELAAEYERITRRSREDPGTAGDEGEENWAKLLRDWLPASYHVVTKGRVLSVSGQASGQMDVLVLHPGYPKGLLNKKVYFGPGVVAAFECKLTLRKRHIMSATDKGAKFRRMLSNEYDNYPPPIYGLLAHAHEWKSPDGEVAANIATSLHGADLKYVKDPVESLDLTCVASLGTWSLGRFPEAYCPTGKLGTSIMGPIWNLKTGEIRSRISKPPPPVGQFLVYLLGRLSLQNKELFRFSEYLAIAGLASARQGEGRIWQENTLPENVRDQYVI